MNTTPETPDTTAVVESRTAAQERIRRIGGRTVRLLCRPTVIGLEHVPETGGFIVASNHLSFLDSVLIQGIFPRAVSFFAKAEYFTQSGLRGKGMRFFFESFGSVPVDRDKQSGAVEALYELTSIISSGHGVGIYPEGTRSRDGRLYRGKNGVGWLALATGAPVIPVGLRGTEKLQHPDKNMMRPAKFQMHVGQPLQFEKLGEKHSMKPRKEATNAVMDAIAALSGQERVDEYNARPAKEADG
ncbi:lysophospholipid acyltransferase family protein [Nesterenkonia ebinurensis]|uniref:lysophospholipid acyltransferase family protein n=1 Tax=Nesterenkonia ebinurensis TaxID=2608252 RepID=UPI00123DF8B3|nr:lysophospholipid acyltransferase family protein [Nesterenkonia ebinurensis]